VAAITPLEPEEWAAPDRPQVSVATDAARFLTDDLIAALQLVSRQFPVSGTHLFQFSALSSARVIIDVSWPLIVALGPNLAASAIWDGLKYLVLRSRIRSPQVDPSAAPTGVVDLPIFEFDVSGADFTARAVVRTEDPEVLNNAMAALRDGIAAAALRLPPPTDDVSKPMLRLGYDEQEGWKAGQ
jgi:hypothetical protein